MSPKFPIESTEIVEPSANPNWLIGYLIDCILDLEAKLSPVEANFLVRALRTKRVCDLSPMRFVSLADRTGDELLVIDTLIVVYNSHASELLNSTRIELIYDRHSGHSNNRDMRFVRNR